MQQNVVAGDQAVFQDGHQLPCCALEAALGGYAAREEHLEQHMQRGFGVCNICIHLRQPLGGCCKEEQHNEHIQ